MSAELVEGLRLAGAGMALVFSTLVALMIILFALGRLFPGEEAEEAEAPESQSQSTAALDEAAAPVAEPPAPIEAPPQVEASPPPAPVPAPAPPVAIEAQSREGVPGSKVAALAVAVYLAMEQEESELADAAPVPVSASQAAPQPAELTSNWSNLGRAALWRSQGRRPSAYGERTHSAFPSSRGRGA